MVLDTEVTSIFGNAWFIVRHTLFELVPVWPTVPYGVVFQHVQSLDVFLVGLVCETVKRLATIFLCEFLNVKHILEEILFISFAGLYLK